MQRAAPAVSPLARSARSSSRARLSAGQPTSSARSGSVDTFACQSTRISSPRAILLLFSNRRVVTRDARTILASEADIDPEAVHSAARIPLPSDSLTIQICPSGNGVTMPSNYHAGRHAVHVHSPVRSSQSAPQVTMFKASRFTRTDAGGERRRLPTC